jgi:hypothetical protein
MTVKNLLEYFENYYGEKYTGILLDSMLGYFKDRSENFLQATLEVIIRRFPRIYNKVPDIAVIEKNTDEIYYSMPKPELLEEPKREWTEEKLKENKEGINLIKEKIRELEKTAGEKPMTEVFKKLTGNIG